MAFICWQPWTKFEVRIFALWWKTCLYLNSVILKEHYTSENIVRHKLCHDKHEDVFFLGQRVGFTKYLCFLCLWYFRPNDQHWDDWPICEEIVVGTKNVIKESLVNCDRIILSPLHIILGLMKQFFKALNQDAACFSYTCTELPNEKLQAGLFDATQIRKLINDENFVSHITEIDATAWTSLFFLVKGFLDKKKAGNSQEIIEVMLKAYDL